MRTGIAQLSRYGAWAPMVLFSWVNTHNDHLPDGFAFCNAYLGFSLVMLAVVAACLWRRSRGETDLCGANPAPLRAADWAASLGMAVSCLFIVAPETFGASRYIALAGSLMAGLGIGWSYVRWAVGLTRHRLRDLIRIVFAGGIAWAVLRMALYALPLSASTAGAVAVSLLSGLMLGRTLKLPVPEDPAHAVVGTASCGADAHSHDGGFSTWRLWLVIVAITITNQIVIGSTLPYLVGLSSLAYPIKAACTIALIGLILAWTLRSDLAFDFILLWRGLYLLTAGALVVVALAPPGPILGIAPSVAADLSIPIIWLTVCTVAHHTSIPSYLVVGVGLGAYGATSFVGLFAGKTAAAVLELAPLCVALLFLLFIVLALCLDSRNPDLLRLFDDLRGRQVRVTDFSLVNARCAAMGADRHLTPREVEVMQMLCAGRSRSYIAETLYISENTVKTHADRLYKKLEVHSREELQELVGT